MQTLQNPSHPCLADAPLRAMFEARKRVFVDLLKWDVPVVADIYELDQFDTPDADYLILTDDENGHRASARLLRTDRPHILGELFSTLCDGPVPVRSDLKEITRFCIEPTLSRSERRDMRNQLVTALVDHALATGLSGYTAVAAPSWYRQIAGFGWQCRALGPAQNLAGEYLVALEIAIDRTTSADLVRTGIYCAGSCRCVRAPLEAAS